MIAFILKMLFGTTDPDFASGRKPIVKRFPSKYDPAKDRTVIVIGGKLDSRRLQGAVDVLAGKKHARTFPKLMPQKEPRTGYIPIRFRAEDR